MSGRPQPPRNKKTRNPRNSTQYDTKSFFETIYGPEDLFTEDSIPKFTPRFAGYSKSAMKPTTMLPLAPAPIDLTHARKAIEESEEQRALKSTTILPEDSNYMKYLRKVQQQVPHLTIPKKHTIKNTVSARPIVLAPLIPAPEPIKVKTPRAANDNLALFDETDFDAPEYNESVSSRLEKGPISGHSLFMAPDGSTEWRPCTVLTLEGSTFTIRWNDTGKTKVVHRLSVKLDSDNPERFEQRRQIAIANRNEIVSVIRQETYLQARSTEDVVLPEPSLMEEIIHLLPKDMQSSKLLPGLVQEINQLYSYSHTICEYESEWKDPVKAKQFEEKGLTPVHSSFKKLSGVPPLPDSRIKAIVLADFINIRNANASLNEFMNDNQMETCVAMLPKTISFSYFFNCILDELRLKHGYAGEVLVQDLNHIVTKIVTDNEYKRDNYVIMMNLRLNYAIATMVMNTLSGLTKSLSKYGVYFRLDAMNDLETFVPAKDVIERVGDTYINMIYSLFNDEKIKALSFDIFSTKLLTVSLPLMEETKDKAISDWHNLVKESFHQINDYIDDIRITTAGIPLEPMKVCIEILPKDFEDFAKNGKMPVVDSHEINLDLVREKLSKCLSDYTRFILKFDPHKKFGAFDTNFEQFFKFIENKKNEFYDLIFKYMNAQTDKQTNLIGGMITKLIESTTCAPDSVEGWYEKHIILTHIMGHIGEIRATLDYLLVMLNFMAEFLFEPEQSYKTTYEIKNNLHKIVLSIDDLNKKDNEEKEMFIKLHNKEIVDMHQELKNFHDTLLEYNRRDVNVDSTTVNKVLLSDKDRYDRLCQTCDNYKERDKKLDLPVTEYPILKEIDEDFALYMPAWEIAQHIETTCQTWLGTVFRQLDVKGITETLVTWEKTVKELLQKVSELKKTERHAKYVEDGVHPLEDTYTMLLKRVQYFIIHLPIIKHLCNRWFRARHWEQISKIAGFQIGPNDGVTWNWLIEIGIEEHIVPIASISNSADNEYKIEKAITQMVEDLTNIAFKVKKTEHGIQLQDPSTTLLILSKHQQIMQDIFVPPYIQPFISKVKDYEVLAANVRQILKQTLETEERINELTPAMESADLKSQHENMTTSFANKVTDFKRFAENFKLSATFHMILANQTTADMCSDISDDILKVRKQLQDVLEEKRKSFPRFRLLSDSQLINVISNSEEPSKIADIFGLMYPSIKEAVFDGNSYCLGFNSTEGEFFEFVNKVKVTPESVENWHKEFADQIKYTLKYLGRKIMQSPISNVEKMALQYPSQLLTLVFEIIFTNNVNKCFQTFENNFTEYAKPKLIDQLNLVLESVKTDLNVCSAAYKKSNAIQISNMIINLMNHRDTLSEILKKNIDSSQDPLWLSFPKYFVKNMEDFSVDVTIGACTHSYGFEYSGSSFPVILSKGICKFFSQMMMCVVGGAFPLACGWEADRKSRYINLFLNAIGKQPFVYPCHYHTTLERMKEFISHAAECDAYVVFKDIYHLKPTVLSDFSTELLAIKGKPPTGIFATYTLGGKEGNMHIPEVLKLTFRPVDVANFDYTRRFRVLLAAMGADSKELAKILAILTKTVTKAFTEPLNTAFSYVSLTNLIQSSPILSDNPCHEIHERIIKYITEKFGEEQTAQLIKYIDATFDEKSDIKVELKTIPMHDDPSINDRLNSLYDALNMHYGVIISGPSLCGKSALIKMYCKYVKQKPVFINPLSIDLHYLYGDSNSGVLSSILQKNDYIVFDGPCDSTWMDTLALGLSKGRRMHFGDGSMLNLRDETRFIIETQDISRASPAIMALCGTIYLGNTFIPTKVKVDYFLRKIANDTNLIEPLTQTIVSSRLPAQLLIDTLSKSINYFKNFVDENDAKPLTSCFKLLSALIYNYYLPSMNATQHIQKTAQELIDNIPKLALFAFYWSWAGRVIDDKREKIDQSLTDSAKDFGIDLAGHKVSEVFFNAATDKFEVWEEVGHTDIIGDPIQMIDREPKHLLFDTKLLMPVAFLARELLSRGHSIMFSCHKEIDQNVLANIIQHLPYIMDHFSPQAYIFPPEATQKDLRKMLTSVLPETKGNPNARSIALRIPLLSVLGFHSNPRSTSSELIRYIITHKSIPSEYGSINETTSGLTFVLCGDEESVNTRISGKVFTVAIPETTDEMKKHAVTEAISVLWNVKQPEIGSVLLDLYNNVRSVFKFSVNHLFSILQRVGIIMVNYDQNLLLECIAHQCVRVFYDAYHDDNILASISLAIRNMSKALGTERNVDVFQIAGKSVLTDINSTNYREVTCFADLLKIKDQPKGPRKQSLIRFTSGVFNDSESDDVIEILKGIPNNQRTDILSVAQSITTPKTHIKFYTELPKLSRKLTKKACKLTKSVLVDKQLGIPLIKSFHDTFLLAGQTRVHHVLFIDADTLTKEDKVLLNLLLETINVYGVFSPGEILGLMTDMYEKRGMYVDPFKEDSLETQKNYNMLYADFITDCEMFFHFAAVSLHPPTKDTNCPFQTVYTPFFGSKEYLETHIQNQLSKLESFRSELYVPMQKIVDSFDALKAMDIIQKYPYLVSATNLSHIVSHFVRTQNERYRTLKEKLDSYVELIEVNSNLEQFIADQIKKMEDMEKQLIMLNDNLTKSSQELERLKAETDQEMVNADREANNLRQEREKAVKFQKELAQDLKKTNSILESAAAEVKNIKATDIAVIKNMHSPPKGVVLVIMALCVILGQDVNINASTNQDFEKIWNQGRLMMSDPGFLKKLTTTVYDVLSPNVLEAIRKITSDPNFEPASIQRASTAAKSICIFIRATVPFCDAMMKHKEMVKEEEEIERNLEIIQTKTNAAVEKLNKCQKEQLEMRERRDQMQRQSESIEASILKQRNKIEDNKIIEGVVKKYIDHISKQYEELKETAKRNEVLCFLTSLFNSVAGPFDDAERDRIYEAVKIDGFERKDLLSTDEPLVAKWQRDGTPVSWQWKENTSFLSPENSRWVVCENAYMLATNYLKGVVNRHSVNFISALSPTFADDFVASISTQVGLVIYDFDFTEPNLVVPVVCRARETGKPFVYNGETINVPKDFFVLFSCKELPRLYSFGMNVELLSFEFDDTVNTEQIALRSFQLLYNNDYTESVRHDTKIVQMRQVIAETEKNLRSTLVSAGSSIFTNDKIQTDFKVLMQRVEDQYNQVSDLIKESATCFDNYPSVKEMAHDLVVEFERYHVASSLWKMFEGAFASTLSIRVEDFKQTVREVVTPFLAAILPEGMRPIEDQKMQSVETIVKNSRSARPVLIVSRDSSFPFNTLLNIYKQKRIVITTPSNSKQVVTQNIQTGSPVCVICTTQESMIRILGAVSKTIGANFVSGDFRLFICVLGQDIELSSELLTKVDVIYFDHPSTVESITRATEYGMKKTEIASGIPELDAEISITNRELYHARVHCFENARLALQCLSIISQKDKQHVLDFVQDYLYQHGRVEKDRKRHFVKCDDSDTFIDFAAVEPHEFICTQIVAFAISEGQNVKDLCAFLDLEGKEEGHKIGNIEVLGTADEGKEWSKAPTFCVRHKEEWMSAAPIYKQGRRVATFYVRNSSPIEIVTLQD